MQVNHLHVSDSHLFAVQVNYSVSYVMAVLYEQWLGQPSNCLPREQMVNNLITLSYWLLVVNIDPPLMKPCWLGGGH